MLWGLLHKEITMFQLLDTLTQLPITIYAVHKSGPSHSQTKFLVHDAGTWSWRWASDFEPLAQHEPWQLALAQ